MEVNTRTLHDASHRLMESSAKIDRTLHEVERIRYQLRELSNVDEFRWILRRNEQSIESVQRTVSTIASVLEDISEKYERTENKVCDRDLMKVRRLPRGGGYVPHPIPHFEIFRRIRIIRRTLPVLSYINRLK